MPHFGDESLAAVPRWFIRDLLFVKELLEIITSKRRPSLLAINIGSFVECERYDSLGWHRPQRRRDSCVIRSLVASSSQASIRVTFLCFVNRRAINSAPVERARPLDRWNSLAESSSNKRRATFFFVAYRRCMFRKVLDKIAGSEANQRRNQKTNRSVLLLIVLFYRDLFFFRFFTDGNG